MTLLTLYPEDQADAEWTTRDQADIAGWLKRIGVAFAHSDDAPVDDATVTNEVDALEHVHGAGVRYLFQGGVGALHLHAEGRVYALICEPGDSIGVPAGMRHWLDRGASDNAARVLKASDRVETAIAVTDPWIMRRFPPLDSYRPAISR